MYKMWPLVAFDANKDEDCIESGLETIQVVFLDAELSKVSFEKRPSMTDGCGEIKTKLWPLKAINSSGSF